MRNPTPCLCALVLVALAWPAHAMAADAADAIVGEWSTSDKKARVRVAKSTTSGAYEGVITWISKPLDDTGVPQHDGKNPDANLRAKPLVGLTILSGAVFDGKSTWDDGKIYDPESGKTYSCTVKLESPTVLKLHGYIGISLLGRNERWSRVEEPAATAVSAAAPAAAGPAPASPAP